MSAAGSSIIFQTLVMCVSRCCSPLKETIKSGWLRMGNLRLDVTTPNHV